MHQKTTNFLIAETLRVVSVWGDTQPTPSFWPEKFAMWRGLGLEPRRVNKSLAHCNRSDARICHCENRAFNPHFRQVRQPVHRPRPNPRILPRIRYNRKFMLRYFTAGESHGEALVAFLSGMPAGLKIDQAFLDRELWRRQQGYGRGGRMKIERDTAHILSGVRHGMTIGSPISVQLENRDWKNWQESLPVAKAIPQSTSALPHPVPATPISPEL